MKSFKDFISECESGAASVSGGSVVGTGYIAGTGVSNPNSTLQNQAEPGVSRKKKNVVLTPLPLTRKH